MTPKDVFRQVLGSGDTLLRAYVGDMSDADLLVRSVPGSNHTAWQLGHLLAGTSRMLTALGHPAIELPEGFAAAHSKETAASDDPARFAKKAEYLALLDKAKSAILAAIEATPDADLDAPAPEAMREFAPTVGAVLTILGGHWLMHSGQLVPIRRKLGRPPLF
jgi:hypothetical protein